MHCGISCEIFLPVHSQIKFLFCHKFGFTCCTIASILIFFSCLSFVVVVVDFHSSKICIQLLPFLALANFEYSSMRTLISGAHGNQHSPELTTPTQWKDSALARSQNSPQNASASCCMHIAAFTYHPTTTHHASKLPFLLKKKKKKKK